MYRLRCFGTMTLEGGEQPTYSLRSRKHWALLVHLLGHRGRLFPRERLAALFWDTEPRLARHSLSQALYDIRSTLPGVEFESSTSQVGAGAGEIAFDGETFEAAVRSGDLRRAVRLYGGRFAPDVEDAGNADFTRWLESERQRYRRLAEMALYRHVRASHDRGDWGEMCVSALRLLDMNPLNENAHRALMRGLWLQGDRESAVHHFDDVHDFLAAELPGGVSDETLDLARRIRSRRPPPEAEGSPSAETLRPDMVGRQDEFGRLREALDNLLGEDRGGLVRVRGEAGVGKTRLLEEFRGVADLEAVRLLESRCYAAESDVPYGPVVDGLTTVAEDHAPDAADEADRLTYYQLGHLFPDAFDRPAEGQDAFAEPDAGRRRLYEETADLLRRAARREPIVWLVEDVHWIDPSSASLLHYLARRLSDVPFLVVVTARTHEEATGSARDLLEDGDAGSLPDVVDVELEPLEHDEIEELLASTAGEVPLPETVDRIHVLAGGNPFYALELARASASLEDSEVREVLDRESNGLITASLRSVLERRLRGLPSDAVRMMETVAVAGRHATASLVREVTEFAPARIADLAGVLYDRGLLRDVDGRLEFLHDITRDFVYARMGELQLATLHLSVGEFLAGRDGAADPATLARHFAKGDERSRAYDRALEAARDAERRHAHDEAMQMARMAVDLAADEEEKAKGLEMLGMAQFSGGKFDLACETFEQLRQQTSSKLYGKRTVALAVAKSHIELCNWEQAHHELDNLRRTTSRAAKPTTSQLEVVARCLYLRLQAAFESNDHSLAREIVEEIKDFRSATRSSLLPPNADALTICSLAAYQVFVESAKQSRDTLLSLSNIDQLSVSLQLKFLTLLGIALYRSGEWKRAVSVFKRSKDLATRYNDIQHLVRAYNNLLCAYMDHGYWEQAELNSSRARELGRRLPDRCGVMVYLDINDADMDFSQGRYRRARDKYRDLLEERAEILSSSCIRASLRSALGLSCLASGHRDKANEIYADLGFDSWKDIAPAPERETAIWFKGYMLWLNADHQRAEAFMESAGQLEKETHAMSGLRVLWLNQLFASHFGRRSVSAGQLLESKIANSVREADSGWFLRFSMRWLRATRADGTT